MTRQNEGRYICQATTAVGIGRQYTLLNVRGTWSILSCLPFAQLQFSLSFCMSWSSFMYLLLILIMMDTILHELRYMLFCCVIFLADFVLPPPRFSNHILNFVNVFTRMFSNIPTYILVWYCTGGDSLKWYTVRTSPFPIQQCNNKYGTYDFKCFYQRKRNEFINEIRMTELLVIIYVHVLTSNFLICSILNLAKLRPPPPSAFLAFRKLTRHISAVALPFLR